jgi:hypothetical protein
VEFGVTADASLGTARRTEAIQQCGDGPLAGFVRLNLLHRFFIADARLNTSAAKTITAKKSQSKQSTEPRVKQRKSKFQRIIKIKLRIGSKA